MKVSLALPSKIAISEKENLVKIANDKKLGIFVSDLPPNHNLFELMALWCRKYPNIHTFGTAIISPLTYDIENLKYQIKALFDIHKNIFEIGLGVGDRKFIPKQIKKPYQEFKLRIDKILEESAISGGENVISCAGSGQMILKLANKNKLGVIFNGIPDFNIIELFDNGFSTNNISNFLMAEFASFEDLSISYITIVSRILSGLSKGELVRLQISSSIIEEIRRKLQEGKLNEYQSWLSPELIQKVAFFGLEQDFVHLLSKMKRLKLKQVILSIPHKESRDVFFKICTDVVL